MAPKEHRRSLSPVKAIVAKEELKSSQGSLLKRVGPAGEFVQRSSRPRRGKKRKRADGEEALPLEKQALHTPWLALLGVTEYESKEQRLHDEIVAYAGYILPTPQEIEVRKVVSARVEGVVKRRFRDAQVHTYGSACTNLSLPHGDVDLVIETKYVVTAEDKKSALYQLRGRLRNDGIASDIQVNARARVPVLDLVSTPQSGSVNVDVTINGADGPKAIDIINDYLKRMPALRPLILVLKGLLQQHNLHSAATSGLSSYAVTCMVINFLQRNPTDRPKEFFENPIQFEAMGHLLMDFLKYYSSDFPYSTSYISVRNASIPSKESKGWVDEKAPERLCIECLINPENDIARATGKIKQVRTLFQESYSALQAATLEHTNYNTLGTILKISQETIDYRKTVRRIVDGGSIHRLPVTNQYSKPRPEYSKRPRY
ncbi:hypothetical protein EW146_g2387 [Bondarzewia mesenterica]|uniref:polynucleotide adenylyltransferase n=1 Tax=Bondarzewia mesenterica TaxID=1095465 RepID=A0A4S4M2P4_9AGAM|nr:hypothetical protein EW146_g2387 [Bondarzewia mesenterica]